MDSVREEWILMQWLSSILGENIGQVGDWTSDLLFSSPNATNWAMGLAFKEVKSIVETDIILMILFYFLIHIKLQVSNLFTT